MRRKDQGILITRPGPAPADRIVLTKAPRIPGDSVFDKIYVPFAVFLFGSGIRNGVDGMNAGH